MHQVTKVAGSQRNFTIRVWGDLQENEDIKIPTDQRFLKLSSMLWVIQEKMCIFFGWGDGNILLPMESRNSVRFDQTIGTPEGWSGEIHLIGTKLEGAESKRFFVLLDFDR